MPGEGAGGALPARRTTWRWRSRRCWRRRRARPLAAGGSRRRSPYPGLRSFTEKDAGAASSGARSEVEALWERLRERRLLARDRALGGGQDVVRARGRRGVAARGLGGDRVARRGGARSAAWARRSRPSSPATPRRCGSSSASRTRRWRSSCVVRWRRAHAEALLVVDQFEELFTLNPPEVQARFAALLGRLASGGGRPRPALAARRLPDAVQRARGARAGLRGADAARRAEPGRRCGGRSSSRRSGAATASRTRRSSTRWSTSVEGARAALPLLAFAVARLWEKRDRERKLLTREAYEEIGGVAGALAQHAEATLDRIGAERQGDRAGDLPQPGDRAGRRGR